MEDTQYLIGELANMSGLTVRTIRYYMDEDLLPPPQLQGKYAYFNETYLLRLKLIQRLKDAYLPLREIKRILDPLTDDQIKEFAEKKDLTSLSENVMPPSASRSAADYIENVMRNQSNRNISSPRLIQSPPAPPFLKNFDKGEPQLQHEGSTWRRIELQKGIEIHIDERIIKHEGGKIVSIIEHFKRVLRSEL
jgi:DNA-binding transcriptional MerR regulator